MFGVGVLLRGLAFQDISRLTLKVGTRGPLRFVFGEFVPHSGFKLSDYRFTMIYQFCGVAQFPM